MKRKRKANEENGAGAADEEQRKWKAADSDSDSDDDEVRENKRGKVAAEEVGRVAKAAEVEERQNELRKAAEEEARRVAEEERTMRAVQAPAPVVVSDRARSLVNIVQGNIAHQQTTAVVNAANEMLLHGSGIAGSIAVAGGPLIGQESRAWVAEHGPVRAGQAVATSGGNLAATYIIHVVGQNLWEHTPDPG